MSRRSLILALVVAIAGACGGGGTTPVGPGPIVTPPPPDPGPVVTNAPPVIGKFTVQGTRTKEPPNFADVLEDLPIAVEVTDPEPSGNELKFNWSAAVGTFTGTGRSVTWKAPADATTPADVTINLEVVETFTSQGKSVENKVTGSTTVSLHDSLKEVGDLSRLFLLDFSDSNLSVATVMRNFQPGCYGTGDETLDVARNRADFRIIDHDIGPSKTTVNFGGTCPFRTKPGDACARVPAYWKSAARQNIYDGFTGQLVLRTGEQTEARGVDQLAAYYYADQKRWRLCDSQFDSTSTTLGGGSIGSLVP